METCSDCHDLAHATNFSLADLKVSPSTLEVTGPLGRREILQPRVMQVLVALARRRGAMMSRDDLIRECWEGRIVGEDALNRTIVRLRRLARDHGGFTLETIPRVGYRITETSAGDAAWRLIFPGGVAP
jgi:DNA-binding winged helix-turn-helix (wHTH) protein